MKTNAHARKVLRLRYWAGLLAVLLLVSAEFWMVCRLGHGCAQMAAQPAVPVPGIGDLFAAR
jgi:hypothetical protein